MSGDSLDGLNAHEGLPDRELLDVEEVARYLGVGEVTIYRWCRSGSLPCMKLGKSWRIRRGGLVEFLRSRERPTTLTGMLRSFLDTPDNVVAVAQNPGLMRRLDAAFFRVGEAHGGLLVKYHASGSDDDLDGLRDDLESNGLNARSLEGEGRMKFLDDSALPEKRVEEIGSLLEDDRDSRSIWVAFNWEERVDLDTALNQQKELSRFVENSRLVIKTSVLESHTDDWTTATWRKAQNAHSGTLWLSESGLTTSRVAPVLDD